MSAKSEPLSFDQTLPFGLDLGVVALAAPDSTAWAGAILPTRERAGPGESRPKHRPRAVRAIRIAGPAWE